MSITSATQVFAILGDPIAHARSPLLYNAAFAAAGIDAVYGALRCRAKEFPGLLMGLARAGGGGNVTLPHKGLAAETVEKPSPRVKATRACNTFWLKGKRVHGENTDVFGFSRAVRSVIPDLKGARVLMVGAGGAARAVLHALLADGCDAVTVLGRTRSRAREIRHVAGARARRVSFITEQKLLRAEGFDLVINATPVGLRANDRLPFRLGALAGVTAVYDLVYRPGGTAWVRYARSLGIPADDGKEMLIQQAAAAFELWFDIDAPLAAMRKAFDSPMETPRH